jgi:soluble lytic murein transglycosylase-like protein
MNTLRVCQPKLNGIFGLWRLMAIGLLLLFMQQAAHADIWGYVDGQGVAHYAAERLDERYEIFYRGGESFDTASAVTGAGIPFNAAETPALRPVVASRVMAFFEVSPNYKVVKHHLREASRVQQIDYELLQALIATESGFDALAVSPKGAIGLMQLMPATAARYGVAGDKKTSLEKKLADPGTNIKTGARYLSYLIKLFPDQLELALAAYNAGEGAVQRAGNKIPHYKETQNYVKTVMQLYTLLKPSALRTASRRTPTRVRMQIQGGALSRGNMIFSAPSTNLAFPETQAQTRD